MLDIYEEFEIVSPLLRGETEGLVELLRSDQDISPRVRSALADFLENPPPGRGSGRPRNDPVSTLQLVKICVRFAEYHNIEKMPVDDSLERMVPEFAMSAGSLKKLIYSPNGKHWLNCIAHKR
jgi:hypothetical protein